MGLIVLEYNNSCIPISFFITQLGANVYELQDTKVSLMSEHQVSHNINEGGSCKISNRTFALL